MRKAKKGYKEKGWRRTFNPQKPREGTCTKCKKNIIYRGDLCLGCYSKQIEGMEDE